MTTTRKLTATFRDGTVSTRTTKIATLSHAWRVHGVRTDKGMEGRPTSLTVHFASGAEAARVAAVREYPTGGKWATFRIDEIEIVACIEG